MFIITLMMLSGIVMAQQTDNHILHAVPAGKVVIDGKLNDWDLSGQVDVFANYRMRNTYSTKVAAMYDKDNFYLSIVWRDPTPMYNMVDSNFDIGSGWKSDCLQLRLKTDMVIGDVTCWYSAAAKHPVVNIAYGRFTGGRDKDTDVNAFNGIIDALKVGAQEAFVMGEDGKSYTQEIALPIKLMTGQSAIVKATGKPYREPKTYGPGDSFNMGMEFLWGPPDGKTFPIHRYADFLQEGKSSREFFWTAENDWGTVKLEPKGNLQLPKPDYENASNFSQKTQGPVALKYTMPFDGFATIVIENEKGIRVKNVIGMAPRNKGKQVDYWDGTDEEGKLVPPGKYSWRGLYHQGIDPTYEASYGTAGVPPWDTADGKGAWMSDHTTPVAVAAGKDTMVLVAEGSEAGWAIIGTDLNGRKIWGERKFQNNRAVAVDDKYVYAGMGIAAWAGITTPQIGRLELATGKYAPFNTKPDPMLIVPVAKADDKADLTGIAVSSDKIAVSLTGLDVVRILDKSTAEKLVDISVKYPGGLAYDAAGVLYVISDLSVVKIVDGKAVPFITTGLQRPHFLAIDKEGRVFVSDTGTQQVKVFDKSGAFIRAIGVAGGRPQPGKWEPNGMFNPNGIAIDVKGRLWVAEEDMWPKRVSVWSVDGQMLNDYIGPTTYGGMGAAVDSADKTRVFGNGCEFKLDYATNKATVTASLIGGNLVGDLMKINGREYFMAKNQKLYLRKGDALMKIVDFGTMRKQDLGKSDIPIATPPATDLISYIWSDLNDDGKVQAEEVTYWPCGGNEKTINIGGWGGYWMDEKYNIVTDGGGYGNDFSQLIPFKSWTAGGVPTWDYTKAITYLDRKNPKSGGSAATLLLADKGMAILGHNPILAVKPGGEIVWTFNDNWWGVHGSHNAPIPENDSVIVGLLSCIGVANTGTPLGKIFAINTNMGRMPIFTTDGLLVATLFQDCRIGSDAWPSSAKQGSPMGGVTMGGEWFGGYFFKSEKTNEYYLVAGGTSYNLIKLNGLNNIKQLPVKKFTYTPKDYAASEKIQVQRAANAGKDNILTISKLAVAPKIDGKLDEYPKDNFIEWSSGQYKARGAVATDGKRLYLAYDITGDANPMVNGGQDVSQLFITGDSVDLQLGTDASVNAKRNDPGIGDLRLLISVLDNKPTAVLYRWKTTGEKRVQTFSSPWRKINLDWVEQVKDAEINITRRNNAYIVEAAIPLQTLGFAPEAGKSYKLDMGVIYSDPTGTNRAARVYWSNKATGLVNDVPGEIMATPNLWGTAKLAE